MNPQEKRNKYPLVKPENWPLATFLNIHGCITAQHPNIFDAFGEFHAELNKLGVIPKNIVEIGTFQGGFTTFLAAHPLADQAQVKTFDCRDEVPSCGKENFANLGISQNQGDIFVTEVGNEIGEFIQRDGLSLVFCDNGSKEREVNLFSKFLKPGDFIFSHDYYKTPQDFYENRDKLWQWHETTLCNLKLVENNVTQVYEDIFDKAVWFCGRKNGVNLSVSDPFAV